ncbi:MAG: hypothetical protein A2Y33_01675 [Spirochaetes bacterium GWF1_51_8]|nr:MAG: hypothetical protein A2Y33_01675 [Spirochaetes bacterium GWF1_51_8]
MKGWLVVILIVIVFGFSFIIMQFRLESKTFELDISRLMQEIETLDSQKRELHVLIDKEIQRLSLLAGKEHGVPISFKDILSVSVGESCSSNIASANQTHPSLMEMMIQELYEKRPVKN